MRRRYAKCALFLLLALPKALPSPAPPERYIIVTTQEQIAAEAAAQGIPTSIALAVAKTESNFNQGARGTSGEVGIFQLMPKTAQGLGVDPADESQNIQGGITYLRQLYNQFGDWFKALAAYNAGPTGASKGYGQTYATNVLSTAQVYGMTASDDIYVPAPLADYSVAGIIPNLSGVPNWAWLAALGLIGVVVLIRRD